MGSTSFSPPQKKVNNRIPCHPIRPTAELGEEELGSSADILAVKNGGKTRLELVPPVGLGAISAKNLIVVTPGARSPKAECVNRMPGSAVNKNHLSLRFDPQLELKVATAVRTVLISPG
jgi:hypothetical protein